MSSQAKKRKKNNHEASDKPVRGLDYFFAKQKNAAEVKLTSAPTPVVEERSLDVVRDGPIDTALTDEQLARKLQDEWDMEEHGVEPVITSVNATNMTVLQETQSQEKYQAENHKDSDLGVVQPSLPFTGKPTGTLSLQSTASDEDTVTMNIPFDDSPLTFDPLKYIPDLQKHWASDQGRATYALLTRCFVLVNATTSRIQIVDTLTNLLRTIIESDPDSLLPSVSAHFSSFPTPLCSLASGVARYKCDFTSIHRP